MHTIGVRGWWLAHPFFQPVPKQAGAASRYEMPTETGRAEGNVGLVLGNSLRRGAQKWERVLLSVLLLLPGGVYSKVPELLKCGRREGRGNRGNPLALLVQI